MPTIFTHALVTGVLGKSVRWTQRPRTTLLCILCGILPDLDGIGFHLGVPYLHAWGHRGMTHSLCFGLCIGLILGIIWGETKDLRSRLIWGLLFGILICTHPFLDMLTTGGAGVALWGPLDHSRVFFPDEWRVIRVSPMDPRSPHLFTALLSELKWVWLPTLCLFLGRYLVWRTQIRTPLTGHSLNKETPEDSSS